MTQEEMRASTAVKIEKIKALYKELQISVSAEEIVMPKSGIIAKIVYYADNEQYPVDAPADVPKAEMPPIEIAEDAA